MPKIRGKFYSPRQGFDPCSPGPESQCATHRNIVLQIEPQGQLPWQIEHFGEPVVCCQICNLVNFIISHIPRSPKKSLKSGNSAVICVIKRVCKEYCFFFGLVSKLGYF